MHAGPISKDIVLLGGGHAHVFVLKSFGMNPEPGVRLTLVAKELSAPYSGMLPGFVAGHYGLEDCQIDLVRLARFAGARLIHAPAAGIDRATKRIAIEGRAPIAYDILSIDIGITPLIDDIAGADEHAIAVKPVSVFAPKWQSLEASALSPDGPQHFAVVGGGAAGVELVLAVRHRLRTLAPSVGLKTDRFSFSLVAGTHVLPSHNLRARTLGRQALARAGVQVIEGDPAKTISASSVKLASGRSIRADAVLISTKAAAPDWFAECGLPVDVAGFLAVRPTLQLLDDENVFAVGDCASVLEHPREKSGVFAVRQGPVVTDNLRRRARSEATHSFIPQSKFLTLLSLGEKSAIAARGPFAASGKWAWAWKDRIDRAFMDRFKTLPDKMGDDASDPSTMRCGGCAAKVGPKTLSDVLDRLETLPGPAAKIANAARDDAAIIDDGGDILKLETVDFFRAFWPDPYVLGEIAANHALNDIFAMGGVPKHAQAIAVLPHGRPRIVAEDLFQLLAGARAVFDRDDVALVGGHSSEGQELAVGFAISGQVDRHRLLRKAGLAVGDKLVLTRPIGTGILFAAEMRGLAKAAAIEAALAEMRRSNRTVATILANNGATAMTDVTGFGLAGHLLEMLKASGLSATLNLGSVPLYPDALRLARSGVVSTLLSENSALAGSLKSEEMIPNAVSALLFDPQTSGGLLAGIAAARADACIASLKAFGARGITIIGEVQGNARDQNSDIEIVGAFPE